MIHDDETIELLRSIDDFDAIEIPVDFETEVWNRMRQIASSERLRQTAEPKADEWTHEVAGKGTERLLGASESPVRHLDSTKRHKIRFLAVAATMLIAVIGLQQWRESTVGRIETTPLADSVSDNASTLERACSALADRPIEGLTLLTSLTREAERSSNVGQPDADVLLDLAARLAATTSTLEEFAQRLVIGFDSRQALSELSSASRFLDQAGLEIENGELERARSSISAADNELQRAQFGSPPIPCLEILR